MRRRTGHQPLLVDDRLHDQRRIVDVHLVQGVFRLFPSQVRSRRWLTVHEFRIDLQIRASFRRLVRRVRLQNSQVFCDIAVLRLFGRRVLREIRRRHLQALDVLFEADRRWHFENLLDLFQNKIVHLSLQFELVFLLVLALLSAHCPLDA